MLLKKKQQRRRLSRRKRREKNRKRRKRKRRKRKKGRVRGYKGIYNLLFIISLAFSSPLTLPPNTPGCLDLLELIRSRLN
jgi:cell division septal protein FtsQ